MAIGVIISFVQIFQLNILFLVPSALAAVCSIYFFVCVYSLYEVFKKEKIRKQPNGVNVYYENVAL
jgi:hypothetical protein